MTTNTNKVVCHVPVVVLVKLKKKKKRKITLCYPILFHKFCKFVEAGKLNKHKVFLRKNSELQGGNQSYWPSFI